MSANEVLPGDAEVPADELTEAERELQAAREELGRVEFGADDTAALERHAAALNRRNALRKAAELAVARLRLAAAERGPGDVGGGWVRVVPADDLRTLLAEYDRMRAELARLHAREGA